MKRIGIIILVALHCILLSAQITTGTYSIGTRMINSTSVKASYIDFGRTVYDMFLSPQQDYMLVMFREMPWDSDEWESKGEIGLLSLADQQLLWTQPFDYSKQEATNTRWGVLITNGKKVSLLDKQNGNTVWEAKMSMVKADNYTGVVMGYKTNVSDKLMGYDISTGQQLWTVKLPHDENWGWENAVRDDSTHLIVTCNNLSRLNLLTGELQVHEAKTGVTHVKGVMLQGLVGFAGAFGAAALSGGMYSYYPLYVAQNMVTGLHSGVVKDNSVYYFSDRKYVTCLDSTLNTIWQTELPARTATHASLLVDDSLVYMFSYGYGIAASGPKKMGRPFIATFDKHTGKEVFMNQLTVKKDIVVDAMLTPNGVYMMFDDGLAYQSDLRSPETDITNWDYQQHGRLYQIISNPLYVYYPLKGTFQLIKFDGQNCPVMTDDGCVYVINEHLDIWDRFRNGQLYFPVVEQGDRMWVKHRYPEPDLWVLHQLGVPEYHITMPVGSIRTTDDRIYLQGDTRIYFLDQLP